MLRPVANDLLELLEDVDDADEFEDQQHDEHDADTASTSPPAGSESDAAVERLQFAVRQCGNARLRVARVDAEPDHLLAHGVLREQTVDLVDCGCALQSLIDLTELLLKSGVPITAAFAAGRQPRVIEVQAHRPDQRVSNRKSIVLVHESPRLLQLGSLAPVPCQIHGQRCNSLMRCH